MLHGIQRGADLPPKGQGVVPHPRKQEQKESVSATHFSSDKVTLSYENDNGEKFKVEMERTQFQQVDMETYSDADKAKWREIIKDIHKQFEQFKAEAIREMINLRHGKNDDDKKMVGVDLQKLTPEDLKVSTDELISKMPEMWRPEAVSDRIVEFATNYFGSTESEGEDFYKLALSAIEEGFKMAGQELGDLPGEVDSVISRTHEMVLNKLERWAEQQGIITRENIAPENETSLEVGGVDISA